MACPSLEFLHFEARKSRGDHPSWALLRTWPLGFVWVRKFPRMPTKFSTLGPFRLTFTHIFGWMRGVGPQPQRGEIRKPRLRAPQR